MDEVGMSEYTAEEEVSDAQKRLADFFKKNIYEIAIIAVCLVRVVAGLADIIPTGRGVISILGDSAVTIVFGVLLARLLEGKGLLCGEGTKAYQTALEDYRATAKDAGKYITEIDGWCALRAKKEYQDAVTTLLYPLGLSYEQYVKGEYDVAKFNKRQLEQLRKVQTVNIHVYTAGELMSGALNYMPNKDYSKVTKRDFIKRSTKWDFVSKAVVAIIFGYYTLPNILTWNWSGLLWTLLETVLIFGLSVMKYFSAYNFITEEMLEKIVNKTTILKTMIAEKETEAKNECEPIICTPVVMPAVVRKIKMEGENEDGENVL